jgi:hypothetical protein
LKITEITINMFIGKIGWLGNKDRKTKSAELNE